MRPDEFFGETSLRRLDELMQRWRKARDAGMSLSSKEAAELEKLRVAELEATAQRASEMSVEAFQARRAEVR